MYSRNFYLLILLSFVWTFQSLDAQNITLFSQAQEAEGTAISGSSSSRSIHIADDFVLTSWVFRSYGATLFGSNGATFRDTTILDKFYDYSFFSAPFLMDSPLRSIL